MTRHGIDRMCTSIIVAAELRFGAAKKGSKRLLHRIETALGNLDVQPFAAPPTSAMPICAPTSNEGTDAIAAHVRKFDTSVWHPDKRFELRRAASGQWQSNQ